jgi:putative tricarboxylic transport membrane protein
LVDVPPPDVPPQEQPRARARASKDLLAGVSLVAVALFALWASSPLPAGTLRSVGPGLMPRAVGVVILVLGLALSVVALVRGGEPLGRWPLRGPVFVALAVVAFSLTIRSVGLVLAGPVVVLVSGAASTETRPVELLVFALVMTAFCIGLFKFALGLPIPVLIIPGVVTI